MIEVKRPRLLDSNLAESAALKPLGLQLSLQTPGVSTATLTLGPNDPEPEMHSWIELYNQNGSVGIFRITSPATDYAQQSTLTLRHGIDSFADSVLSAQEDFEGTPEQLLTRMIAAQTTRISGVAPWALGTIAATSTIKMSLNYNRLSELLQNLEEQLEGYYFEYDQSVFPWVISVKAVPSAVDSEFRLNRNVMTISRTLSDNDLCTQLILSINSKVTVDNVTTNKQYIKTYNNTAAQAVYGIVQKTADIDTGDNLVTTTEQPIPSTPEADAWAARFMADHAAPTVQIQMTAQELSRITGDEWDETKLGHICRVALPQYDQVFSERVVNVTYPDALGQPDTVSVSLANQLPKFSSSIAQLRAETARLGRSGRGGARAAADADQLEVWSKHVKYEQKVLGDTGVITLYESGIDMDPLGGVTIFSLQEGLQSLYSGITVNTDAITLKVSKGEVGTQLAVECGNVHISGTPGAANLVVDGYVEATEIFSASGTLHDIYSETIHAQDADVNGDCDVGGDLSVYGGLSVALSNTVTCGPISCGNLDCDGISINGGSTYTSFIANASVSSNTLTLTKSDGTTVNFSKAGPITAISKVSQSWKPAKFTHGGFDVEVVASGTGLANLYETVEVDAAYAYSAGWTDGYDVGVLDGEAKFTQATVTPQGASETVYVSNSSGTEYYKKSSTSYNRIGTHETYKYYGSLYAPEGSGPSWVVKGTGTWYLWTGDHRDAYLYHVGSSVTPVDSNSKITIKSETRYQEGTPDTTTYYTKSSS